MASGNLELARETGDEEPLERAAAAIERTDEMVDDLSTMATEDRQTLSRSRVADHSAERVPFEPLALVGLIEDIWDVMRTDDATLVCDLPDGTLLYAPEAAIRPVLENLLKNAIRHGGPEPTVRVGHVPDGGFFVEDDGPGIPVDVREEVFEPGFTTAEDGSGTGLALVADVADKQGWVVDVGVGELGGARIDVRNCLIVTTPEPGERVEPEIPLDAEAAVGEFELGGEATFDGASGQWTVIGGGMNIWQDTNELYYVHTALEGPVSIQARVADLENVGDYSKAGLMVRDSLAESATYGHIGVIPDNRTEVLWRTREGENGVSQFVDRDTESSAAFRLDRVGNRVTVAIWDDDGDGWTPVNERYVALEDPVHVGLVVCSYRPNSRCEAVFEDVSVRRLDAE